MWLQTGLARSNSRWLSQFAALTMGGPLPQVAYAMRAPSCAVHSRICCLHFGAVADMSLPAAMNEARVSLRTA
jgi:hypothetical protein